MYNTKIFKKHAKNHWAKIHIPTPFLSDNVKNIRTFKPASEKQKIH